MAFFRSGIKPSGVTVSGLIAVVFILKTPARRQREEKEDHALNQNVLDTRTDLFFFSLFLELIIHYHSGKNLQMLQEGKLDLVL